jgi:hypothetical protein
MQIVGDSTEIRMAYFDYAFCAVYVQQINQSDFAR